MSGPVKAERIEAVGRAIHDAWKEWVFGADGVTMCALDDAVADWQDMMLELAIAAISADEAARGSVLLPEDTSESDLLDEDLIALQVDLVDEIDRARVSAPPTEG